MLRLTIEWLNPIQKTALDCDKTCRILTIAEPTVREFSTDPDFYVQFTKYRATASASPR